MTHLAAQLCSAPAAMLALVNPHRQYLKSLSGIDQPDRDRLLPLCVHAAQTKQSLLVEDTLQHDWFSQHSMVTSAPHIRFFAAIPLLGMNGDLIGNLCIIDHQPRTLCNWQIDTLQILARQSMLLLEHNRQQNNLRLLAAHQANIKEQERQRIARDLHDELGQNLLALKMDLTMLLAPSDSKVQKRLNDAINNLNGVVRGLRNIINDLRPPVLELGLSAAVEWQLRQFERSSQLHCILDAGDPAHYNTLTAIQVATLFRILQEALNNIRCHAQAHTVRLRLKRTEQGVEMLISDDGIGFSIEALTKFQSYGLIGIRERLRSSHGKLVIETAPGQGTTLLVTMPIAESDEKLLTER